ncbi:MAG: AAA family ATPase [Ignavibacteria bacterium]|nr:AAA family ATPase [Ignavibacteria bacterium]
MIIKRLEIENFLSYYGSNLLEFDEGATVILGQNNTGKSKLFDAFNWVLYDRAYSTENEEWFDTKTWGEALVNRRAKLECKAGGFVSTSVAITILDDKGIKYLLAREYEIKREKTNSLSAPLKSSLYLSITSSDEKNTESYDDREAFEKICILFPLNLSRYFLFQGESISQIMSLGKRSSFRKALNDLSQIEVFERLKKVTDKVFKQIVTEFDAQEEEDKVLQVKKNDLGNRINKYKAELANLEKQEQDFESELDKIKSVLSKKEAQLKEHEESAKILNEIENLKKLLATYNENREQLIDTQRNSLIETWQYQGIKNILLNFMSIYSLNKKEKRIPEPIRQEFIKEMLAESTCKICGTAAPIGSDQHERIKSFLNDKSLDKEIATINILSGTADRYIRKINEIPNDLETFYTRLNRTDNNISKVRLELSLKEQELANLVPEGIKNDELQKLNYDQMRVDRNKAKSDLDSIKSRLDRIKGQKENTEKDLNDATIEFNKIVAQSSNPEFSEKLLLAGKIKDTAENFYSRFFEKLIKDIENKANEYFGEMTKENRGYSGKIKVDSIANEVYITDDSGNRVENINQANKVSLQISFIAAILDVSNHFWSRYFPFIADAPISALGGDNKPMAIKTMIRIFKQAIIMLKDDAISHDRDHVKNDLVRKLIESENNIKNAYELVMEGENLNDQVTIIKRIK